MRDLEKQWADKRKKEAKPAKTAPKKKSREHVTQAASSIVKEATERE